MADALHEALDLSQGVPTFGKFAEGWHFHQAHWGITPGTLSRKRRGECADALKNHGLFCQQRCHMNARLAPFFCCANMMYGNVFDMRPCIFKYNGKKN